mgnify:CR=1 FL=1
MKWFRDIGPGVLIAAAFIGPGTVTLCTIAGASFGYSLIWAIVLSIFSTIVLQEMSLRIGLITKMNLAQVIRINIKSKSGLHKLLSSLEQKGFIKRIPHKARALELQNIENSNQETDNTEIPFLGRIAAGNPIEAVTGSFEQISVPNYLLSNNEEHFTLEVNGDSMIDEGIFDGDVVVIKKIQHANTGDIVVALIDNNEATLKRIYKRGQQLALQPENPAFKTIIYGPDRVQIQGILRQLIRKY